MCLPLTTRRKGGLKACWRDNPVKDSRIHYSPRFSHSEPNVGAVTFIIILTEILMGILDNFARPTFVKTLDLWVHLSTYNELSPGPRSDRKKGVSLNLVRGREVARATWIEGSVRNLMWKCRQVTDLSTVRNCQFSGNFTPK